jgi:flagellar export protein FliJ
MPAFRFRLQPLLDRKIEIEEEARKALKDCQDELAAEETRLEECRARLRELSARLEDLRRNIMTPGPDNTISGDEVHRRAEYLKALGLDVEAAKDAVFAQKLVVDECEDRVKEAEQHLLECRRQVEVLEKYRDRLAERFRREQERKEAVEQDEIGNVIYLSKRRAQ